MKRSEHTFMFAAQAIADAAGAEGAYHEERLAHWRERFERGREVVRASVSAKLVETQVTGGTQLSVVADYGDLEAWRETQTAFGKIQDHRLAAEQYRTDERVYRSQGDRYYDLDAHDVAHFRLGGEARDEAADVSLAGLVRIRTHKGEEPTA